MARILEELFVYLDSLTDRADLDELTAELRDLEVGDQLRSYYRFLSNGYARNLIREGPFYMALALCWKNGQRSPIHDHAGSSCGVRVLRGVATETRFEFTPSGYVYATGSHNYGPGSVLGSQDSDLHQVSNLQAGDADLVTLHVYSPSLLRMGTYSLTDRTRGEEPMLLEFCDAAGI
jgi:cysteine dioxygenase